MAKSRNQSSCSLRILRTQEKALPGTGLRSTRPDLYKFFVLPPHPNVYPQSMLRRRRGDKPLATTPPCTSSNFTIPTEGGAGLDSSSHAVEPRANASGRPGDARLDEDNSKIERVVRKLASKKWVVFYDSLKAMFLLQAEGIAREVVAAISEAAAVGALGKGEGEPERRAGGVAVLEGLRASVAAWEAYKDWCEEVGMRFGSHVQY